MNQNTRLAVGVHILALLALEPPDSNRSSERIARSINTNPVVVRRLLSQLKKGGLVTTKAGVSGAALSRPAEQITLLDVYRAVQGPQQALFNLHAHPNPKCYISRNLGDALANPFLQAQNALEQSLAQSSVADAATFINDCRIKNQTGDKPENPESEHIENRREVIT